MSEEDLELLITLDDPVEAPEEDTFNHLDAEKARGDTTKGQRNQEDHNNEVLFTFI